jgi:hypothetical protein
MTNAVKTDDRRERRLAARADERSGLLETLNDIERRVARYRKAKEDCDPAFSKLLPGAIAERDALLEKLRKFDDETPGVVDPDPISSRIVKRAQAAAKQFDATLAAFQHAAVDLQTAARDYNAPVGKFPHPLQLREVLRLRVTMALGDSNIKFDGYGSTGREHRFNKPMAELFK